MLAFDGIPLIYSGDEIATLNDYSYKKQPAKANDSRWLHRTKFDWKRAKNRLDINTFEGAIFQNLKKLIALHKQLNIFDSNIRLIPFDTGNKFVFGGYKKNGAEHLILIANFTEHDTDIDTQTILDLGFKGPLVDLLDNNKQLDLKNQKINLEPYKLLWLK